MRPTPFTLSFVVTVVPNVVVLVVPSVVVIIIVVVVVVAGVPFISAVSIERERKEKKVVPRDSSTLAFRFCGFDFRLEGNSRFSVVEFFFSHVISREFFFIKSDCFYNCTTKS